MKLSKDVFYQTAKDLELLNTGHESLFLISGCDLVIKPKEHQDYVCAYGKIPMDLAYELYNNFKNMEEQISNTGAQTLVDPKTIVDHPNLNVENIMCISKTTNKKSSTLWVEMQKECFENDYENCYLDISYIYTREALIDFVKIARDYYIKNPIDIQNNSNKQKKYVKS